MKMKVILASLVSLLLVAGLATRAGTEMGTLTGEVTRVEAKTKVLAVKVVQTDNPREVTFETNEKTKFLKNGNTIGLGDIRVGDRVTVNYEEQGGTQVALTIGVQAGPNKA